MSYNYHKLKLHDRNLKQVLLQAKLEGYTYIDPDDGEINEKSPFWIILVLRKKAPYVGLLCCSFNELNINQKFDIVSGMQITGTKRLRFENIHSLAVLILEISNSEKSKKFQLLMQKIINCRLTADDVLRVINSHECTNLIKKIETEAEQNTKISRNIVDKVSLEESTLFTKEQNDNSINFTRNVINNSEEPNFLSITKRIPTDYEYFSEVGISKNSKIKHKGYFPSQNSSEHFHKPSISEKASFKSENFLINKNKMKHNGEFNYKEINESTVVNSSIKEENFNNSKRRHNKMSFIHEKMHLYISDALEKDENLCRAFYDMINYTI